MPPQTPFEQTGEWTTTQEEEDFLSQIVSETDLSVENVWSTREGRNIALLTLGEGGDHTFLTVAGQHGNEPAAREAALIDIRDWAYSESSSDLETLEDFRLAWIPNANPDGAAEGSRTNSVGVDPNRDHLHLEEAEAEAINAAIRQVDPLVIVDMHESSGTIADLWLAGTTSPYVPLLLRRQIQACDDAMVKRCTDEGWEVRRYLTTSGAGVTLRTASTMYHAVGLLTETSHAAGDPEERVEIQKAALDTWRGLLFDDPSRFVDARQSSIDNALQSQQGDTHVLSGPIYQENFRTIWVDGYQLAEELDTKYVDAFDIQVNGGFVPIRQSARGFLPLMLDGVSSHRVSEGASRVGDRSTGGGPGTTGSGIFVQLDGVRRRVSTVWAQEGSTRRRL